MNSSDQTLLCTVTGEPFQPARLYYHISNKKTVINVFRKLRCMEYDRSRDRWVWTYDNEAQKIHFDRSYKQIPKDMRPVVIGYFLLTNDQEMQLELNSFKRVVAAIEFFQKHINRHAAQITKLRVVNKMTSVPDNPESQKIASDLRSLLDSDRVYIPNYQQLLEEIEHISTEDQESKDKAINDYLTKNLQKELPEIEEILLDPDDEDLGFLNLSLALKQKEALQHWLGNTDYNQLDAMSEIFEALYGDEDDDDDDDDYENDDYVDGDNENDDNE